MCCVRRPRPPSSALAHLLASLPAHHQLKTFGKDLERRAAVSGPHAPNGSADVRDTDANGCSRSCKTAVVQYGRRLCACRLKAARRRWRQQRQRCFWHQVAVGRPLACGCATHSRDALSLDGMRDLTEAQLMWCLQCCMSRHRGTRYGSIWLQCIRGSRTMPALGGRLRGRQCGSQPGCFASSSAAEASAWHVLRRRPRTLMLAVRCSGVRTAYPSAQCKALLFASMASPLLSKRAYRGHHCATRWSIHQGGCWVRPARAGVVVVNAHAFICVLHWVQL